MRSSIFMRVLMRQAYYSKRNIPKGHLQVYDFYNPETHTEVSIKRARKAYPPFPGTIAAHTAFIPIYESEIDLIFVILSAHEIRNEQERILFFSELSRILRPSGKIIVAEHLRDLANFAAYSIGFIHFISRNKWLQTFHGAELIISDEINITPFITTFILSKNGTTA